MSRRSDLGPRTRLRAPRWLAGATIATFLFATAASADISSISPSSGTVEPKGSATASFTVVDSLTSCFTAEAPPRFSVTFDGLGLGVLPFNCALEGAQITMTVTASAKPAPGDYQITISETSLGNELLGTHEWPFTVPASPTTTTTLPTTTTTAAPTTTTTKPSTTTTVRATTTTSQVTTTSNPSTTTTSTDRATSTTDGGTDAAAGGTGANGSRTITTSPAPGTTISDTPNTGGGDNTSAGETAETLPDETPDESAEDNDPEDMAAGAPDDDLPYDRYPANPGDEGPEVLSRTIFSDQLRSQISRAVPLAVADAVLSPVVIVEYLIRSLLQSAMSFLVPVLIATFVGLWMVWRMREEIDDDELALSRQSMG